MQHTNLLQSQLKVARAIFFLSTLEKIEPFVRAKTKTFKEIVFFSNIFEVIMMINKRRNIV